jgi:acetyl esterase/lipase
MLFTWNWICEILSLLALPIFSSMTLLILSLLFFIFSLLLFFDLSHPFLWKLSLGATEYGHLFVLVPVMIAAAAGTATAVDLFTTVVSCITIFILLAPSVMAALTARQLPKTLESIFGPDRSEAGPPFRWRSLWVAPEFPGSENESFVYAQHEGVNLSLIFFRARSSEPAPCVVIIHTGGWDSGSPDEFGQMNQYLASKGYAVASIAYRFAPKFRWPAQREDTLAAIAFLKMNAARLGVDPKQFVLFGRSAGGQIAETVAYTSNDPSIKGCIGFYAPADLIFAYEHLPPEPDILDSRTLLHKFLGGPLSENHDAYFSASSYQCVTAGTVPTLLIHGAKDPLTWYRQSERLSRRLTDHGVANAYIEIPWGTHAFDYNFNSPGGQISRFAVEYFLSVTVNRSE